MPESEKPLPQREEPEPAVPDRIVNPGDEVGGDGNADEHEITQRTRRITDEILIDELVDEDDPDDADES